jgi:hypothetical protein
MVCNIKLSDPSICGPGAAWNWAAHTPQQGVELLLFARHRHLLPSTESAGHIIRLHRRAEPQPLHPAPGPRTPLAAVPRRLLAPPPHPLPPGVEPPNTAAAPPPPAAPPGSTWARSTASRSWWAT